MNFATSSDFHYLGNTTYEPLLHDIEIDNDVMPVRGTTRGIRGMDFAYIVEALAARNAWSGLGFSLAFYRVYWVMALRKLLTIFDAQPSSSRSVYTQAQGFVDNNFSYSEMSSQSQDVSLLKYANHYLTDPIHPIEYDEVQVAATYDGDEVFRYDGQILRAEVYLFFPEIRRLATFYYEGRMPQRAQDYTGYRSGSFYWQSYTEPPEEEGGEGEEHHSLVKSCHPTLTYTPRYGFSPTRIEFYFAVYRCTTTNIDDGETQTDPHYYVTRKRYTGAYTIVDGEIVIAGTDFENFVYSIACNSWGFETPTAPATEHGSQIVCDCQIDYKIGIVLTDTYTDYWNL